MVFPAVEDRSGRPFLPRYLHRTSTLEDVPRRQPDLATQAARLESPGHASPDVIGQHLFEQDRSKALAMRGDRVTRHAGLAPVQHDPAAVLAAVEPPSDADEAARPGQGAEFQRVGHELMHGKADAFGSLGPDSQGRAGQRKLLVFTRCAGAQLVGDQLSEVETCKRIAGDGALNARERRDAALEMAGKILDAVAAVAGAPDDLADHRQRVANPMLQLGQQQFLVLGR